MLVLQSCAENGILPVGTLAQYAGVAQCGISCGTTLGHHVIIEFCKLAQVQHVNALTLMLPGYHTVVAELGFARLTVLGGNQYDTVSTLGTIDSGGRGVLQDFHRDDVGRVDG